MDVRFRGGRVVVQGGWGEEGHWGEALMVAEKIRSLMLKFCRVQLSPTIHEV